MSGLSEWRERLANALPLGYGERDKYRDVFEAADALLAPGGGVAEIVAAEIDAATEAMLASDRWAAFVKREQDHGAAEVRARVEALTPMHLDEWPLNGEWLHRGDVLDALMPRSATESPAEPRTHHDAATDTPDDPTTPQEPK